MHKFRWLALLAALSACAYLLASRLTGFVGFPLDDAWIHQTFARNLATYHEWAFVPGHPSAGSTSPLWTLLLSAGYGLGVEYHFWVYLLGWAALAVTAWLSARLAVCMGHGHLVAGLAGVLVIFEWHMAWASASGMETLLFCALALVVCLQMVTGRPSVDSGTPTSSRTYPPVGRPASTFRGLLTGLAAGLAVLTRPDGLTLIPFAVAGMLWSNRAPDRKAPFLPLAGLSIGAGLLVAAFLAFNARLSGSVWPNTFYAKQAEYAVLREQPLYARLWATFSAPFPGELALLAPGVAVSAINLARRRAWTGLLPLAWAIGFLSLYAWRLPVTYQHGRYLMPVIPILAVYGLDGLVRWARPSAPQALRRVASRVWIASLAVVTLAFWVIGARRYGQDVALIETEMVASARWLRDNTSPGALIAVHDIGAVGYFSERRILDLAGLVSPEVIPILRDQAALTELILGSGAQYLVTFPGWYPEIVADERFLPVFSTGGRFSPQDNGENMKVYRVAPQSSAVLYSPRLAGRRMREQQILKYPKQALGRVWSWKPSAS